MSPRPLTLRQIAERADSLDEFGRHFRDWLHELRHFSSRDKVVAAVTDEPGRLVKKFAQGGVADAWLAAYAEFIAHRIRRPVPPWALKRSRVSTEPWFATDERNALLRAIALRDSPTSFKNRNLFTPVVDLSLGLRAGRPTKTMNEKRLINAARQRRFRKRRADELTQLRAIVSSIKPA